MKKKKKLLSITGLTPFKTGFLKLMLRIIPENKIDDELKIEFVSGIHMARMSSLWYGGDIVHISYKGCVYHISAEGDVWRIWDDLMFMSAAALAQPFNFQQEREDEYLRRINHYDKSTQALFPAMFREITLALEQEGCYDVLGEIYMELELNNHWKGQFFTPFHVCHMMAKMSAGNVEQEIKEKGFLTVGDACCGGGAMLIAFAKSCQEQDVNYQQDVFFVGQDIDPVVARMCYVQMSMLGMSGYVTIGNSLTQECSDSWYTPFYFLNGFQYRNQRIVSENSENDGKISEIITETPEITACPKVIKPDIEIFRETASGQFELLLQL